ncbi:MAG TPA: hypothetical protein VJT71_01630 [Pyrinomonadaceae bacterium]|nr:hypothetical protein [Pyrinomonadaceae bacterium]
MSFAVHPLILIAAVGAAAGLPAIVIACRAKSGVLIGLMVLLALVFMAPAGYLILALNPALIDGRFRAYKQFYKDIEVGVTREQVLAAMDRRYPATGPRKRPKIMDNTPNRLGFFMNPEASREPNCEGIFLTLEGGRVSKKVYSPD